MVLRGLDVHWQVAVAAAQALLEDSSRNGTVRGAQPRLPSTRIYWEYHSCNSLCGGLGMKRQDQVRCMPEGLGLDE